MRKIPENSKTVALGFRGNESTLVKLADLSKVWGGVLPLSQSDVIRVALDRAHEKEFPKKTKRQC